MRKYLATSLVFLVCSGLCPTACVQPEAVVQASAVEDVGRWQIAVGGGVQFTLAWDWQGAERTADGWRFETDLGYVVEVTEAYVTSHSLELRPCDEQPVAASWWGPSVAFANHGYEPDSSLVEEPVVEAFGDVSLTFGDSRASGWTYCELAYVIAPNEDGDAATEGTDALWLAGSYVAPGGGETAFEAAVSLSGGASLNLPAEAPVDTPTAVHVTLTRYPALAFDGIVFEELVGTEIAWEVLGNLSDMAVVTAEVVDE